MAPSLIQRIFLSLAALACGVSCALAAYASHVADEANAKRLVIAAAFMFAHGAVYFVLRRYDRWIELLARLLLGFALVFSLSLLSVVLLQWRALLAPYAGSGLIISWLVLAVVFLFARSNGEKR